MEYTGEINITGQKLDDTGTITGTGLYFSLNQSDWFFEEMQLTGGVNVNTTVFIKAKHKITEQGGS